MADFFTTNTTFQALQDRISFGRFGDTCVSFGRNSMEQAHRKNHIFCCKPGRCGPIVLIVELDRDIYETVLCTKFHQNRISPSSVIVLTAGRTDILIDSRVYSLFEYTKRNRYSFFSSSIVDKNNIDRLEYNNFNEKIYHHILKSIILNLNRYLKN